MNETDDRFLQVAIEAAQAGGAIVSAYFADLSSAGIEDKARNEQSEGLVTKADVESEQAIVASIRRSFPDHYFLGEESHTDSIDAEHLWIIDPLDGTNNFAHGIPHFAVSVAYYRNGQAHCGAILNPATGQLFTAVQGGGAFLDDTPVRVNAHQRLNQTMIATGFYYDRGKMMKATLATINDLFEQDIHGIRRFGAAALDLVYVGLGRFGGFFEFTLSPWDFAAAALFVREAGGTVTTCLGEPLPLQKTSILATNGQLHEVMKSIVSGPMEALGD
ncbi:inositol monophosphatase [Mariniblastus sp.]|nr:inositol monophosphatase [Mariniblastus sp.]